MLFYRCVTSSGILWFKEPLVSQGEEEAEMSACLEEAEADLKKAKASLKHHEVELGWLKEELYQEKEVLDDARGENADFKVQMKGTKWQAMEVYKAF